MTPPLTDFVSKPPEISPPARIATASGSRTEQPTHGARLPVYTRHRTGCGSDKIGNYNHTAKAGTRSGRQVRQETDKTKNTLYRAGATNHTTPRHSLESSGRACVGAYVPA